MSHTGSEAAALVGPRPRPLAMAGAAQAFDFGRHRPIGDETDHLAQQIRVRALLQKAREAGSYQRTSWAYPVVVVQVRQPESAADRR